MIKELVYKVVVPKCQNIYEDRAEVLNFPTLVISESLESKENYENLRYIREGVFAEFIIDTEVVEYSENSK